MTVFALGTFEGAMMVSDMGCMARALACALLPPLADSLGWRWRLAKGLPEVTALRTGAWYTCPRLEALSNLPWGALRLRAAAASC